jgi:FOG: TPR repeat, SEL1 subfamily
MIFFNKLRTAAEYYLKWVDFYNHGDLIQGLIWLRKSAELGYDEAEYNLGVAYYQGEIVLQDYKQAAYWFEKSAQQGDVKAQYNLGLLYEQGNGVPRNYQKALFWYQKSAEQGDADAQYNLKLLRYKIQMNT